MPQTQDLLTRWPALDVSARRARLDRSLQVSAGPLVNSLKSSDEVAARAADGLWKRDPSVWSRDAAVQTTIADRLGWMTSPMLMAESVDRLRTFAERVKNDRFSD